MKSLTEIKIRSYDFVIESAFMQFDEAIDLIHTATDRGDKMAFFENAYTIYCFIQTYVRKRDELFKEGV